LWLWSVEVVPWCVEPWRPCVDSVQAKLVLRSKNCTCESATYGDGIPFKQSRGPVEAVPVRGGRAEAPLDLVGGAAQWRAGG
jgi:hypothetical protein